MRILDPCCPLANTKTGILRVNKKTEMNNNAFYRNADSRTETMHFMHPSGS